MDSGGVPRYGRRKIVDEAPFILHSKAEVSKVDDLSKAKSSRTSEVSVLFPIHAPI